MNIPSLFRWSITRVTFTGLNSAVIHLRIPGVNQKDTEYVDLSIWDKIRGVTIEQKTKIVVKKWQEICDKKNKEIDQAAEMTANFKM